MRADSGMGETEIQTETLRYSCDIPAQALAYKLGDTKLLALREKFRQGDRQRNGELRRIAAKGGRELTLMS